MKRRNVIKGLALLPFSGSILAQGSELSGQSAQKFSLSGAGLSGNNAGGSILAESNIFRSIGVEPLINCRGTFTIIGGSLERPAVKEAMHAAANNFVQYDELADGIGQKLADLSGAEWGMVSAGCAAGMKHVTAACVTGGNPELLIRIPDLTGLQRTEVIIPRHSRNTYDHSIRNIGVKIVEVSTPEELRAAINPKTAMIYIVTGRSSDTGQPLSLEVIAEIAKPKNIPILVDAAAENLTLPPVHLKRGATVVAYSGGKAICGPQCAGLLLGDKALLMASWQASAPHHGPGRDNKVGREEMMGMLAAVQDWKNRDHNAEWKRWLGYLSNISKKVSGIPGITTQVIEPTDLSNKSPSLQIIWDPAKLHITGEEIAEIAGRSKPRIALGGRSRPDGTTSISITTGQMQPGEDQIVANRLHSILSEKRTPKTETMEAPVANLSGKWDVSVKFFNSTSAHQFNLTQDGNWINGTHKGDLNVMELAGTIEGNQVKFRSVTSITADNITFIFSGEVSGDSMSGNIHLGEYRTATFTAKRNTVKPARRKITVPSGPPLAT